MAIPAVSVIVDTFNHEKFIEQALNSVLSQDFSASELEILVVDDGSTDHTSDILQKYAGRVRTFHKQNGGQASAFNVVIPLARGEIIAFLDGDDWWAENKLTGIMKAFANHPEVGVVGHGFHEFDDDTKQILTVLPESNRCINLTTVQDAMEFRSIMSFLGTSRVAIRKRVLDLIGSVPNTLVVEADEFLSTMAVSRSKAMLLQEAFTYYRLHRGNLYQFRDGDLAKVRRKLTVLRELAIALRRELPSTGLHTSIIGSLIEPIDVEATHLKLQIDGGSRWETFKVERARNRLAYKRMGWKYRTFKVLGLALALVLPTKTFYKVRSHYTRLNLRRIRALTGEPTPRVNVVYRKDKIHGE